MPKLTASQTVVLEAALYVRRGCCLEVSIRDDVMTDIGNVPIVLTDEDDGLQDQPDLSDGTGQKQLMKVRFLSRCGLMEITVNLVKCEQDSGWDADSAFWTWHPLGSESGAVCGRWSVKPESLFCINCGWQDVAPQQFHRCDCMECDDGVLEPVDTLRNDPGRRGF